MAARLVFCAPVHVQAAAASGCIPAKITTTLFPINLTDAGRDLPHGHTALITFSKHDADERRRLLEGSGIATQSLEHHTGASDDRMKVGTVHRAKGPDFRAVPAVQFPPRDAANSDAARQEAKELRSRQRLVAATRARDFPWWGVVDDAA
ncbi:hypothetical protein [Amycolatopsis sp. FDAARGOS 1241]|uniref:hypothetical protein n=1 Tax=Amycolatopsis sp. FDAARGOS 1241 TaxID=2778070 RepID=UPI001950ACBC|nr:hypothetical protein [Amycolatopsis sp. FDAARGOS 1241]QRP44628.1 hypothetical protein I6J71_36090 [Amycolatopsis sp. FDAARGOS 1241]